MASDEAVVPRDAATVVLLRDAADGLEVWLMSRALTMAFAPGMLVFPGGAASDADVDARATAVRETWEETGVRLSAGELRPWSRWVTPEPSPLRYDARFFVAALPAGQEPTMVGEEAVSAKWWSPGAAVSELSSGAVTMMPPTVFTLQQLTAHATVASVLAAAPDDHVRWQR